MDGRFLEGMSSLNLHIADYACGLQQGFEEL